MSELLYGEITGPMIGAACEVWRVLGYGYLKKVYENALVEEACLRGVEAAAQVPIDVIYKGKVVGEYIADILISGKVIVELKAEKVLNPKHQAQLLNYMKATDIRVGLLINFGENGCTWKRLIL